MIAVPCTPPLRFAVVGSPAYFKGRKPPKTPHELQAHTCIRSRLPSGALFKWEFEKDGRKLDLDVAGRLTLDNDNLRIAAALEGEGLTWTSEWSVARHIADGRLVRVLEDWTPPYPGLCLYYPGHRLVPAGLQAFIGLVREKMALSPPRTAPL
jgi:DNA-binding transcriptional LysR family regulator